VPIPCCVEEFASGRRLCLDGHLLARRLPTSPGTVSGQTCGRRNATIFAALQVSSDELGTAKTKRPVFIGILDEGDHHI
jgi:hypothetical protein